MTIRYKCDKCGVSMKIKDDRAGTEGKCPKCKTAFTVPEPDDGDSAGPPQTATADDDGEVSVEDEIFGKDFFKVDDAPKTPRYTMPTFDEEEDDDDDSDEEIVIPQAPASAAAAAPSSVDNAAAIAGGLLSKTGKKNRTPDIESEIEQSGEGGYDFSAIQYLLLWRVGPAILAFVVLVPLFLFISSGMFGSAPELPPLGYVTGTVTLDGKPVSKAQLNFVPEVLPGDMAPGSNSFAISGANGDYEAMYNLEAAGAVLGPHTVRISVQGMIFERKIEVKEGDNPEDFVLDSQAVPTQP